MAGQHTVRAFDDELNELRALIADMGGRAEFALAQAMRAIDSGDDALAAQVVADDGRIDTLETEVERLAVQTIALRAPMADDLRDIVAMLKMAGVIERIGDYAKNIAKRSRQLGTHRQIEATPLLMSMAGIAGEMVHDVIKAFTARDSALALAVRDRDVTVDNFYNSIFRALVTFMMENPRAISEAAHLLFIAKNIERIGDHATNVAEMVHFAITGERVTDREKGDDTLGSAIPGTDQASA